jgi:hypothetical protein
MLNPGQFPSYFWHLIFALEHFYCNTFYLYKMFAKLKTTLAKTEAQGRFHNARHKHVDTRNLDKCHNTEEVDSTLTEFCCPVDALLRPFSLRGLTCPDRAPDFFICQFRAIAAGNVQPCGNQYKINWIKGDAGGTKSRATGGWTEVCG